MPRDLESSPARPCGPVIRKDNEKVCRPHCHGFVKIPAYTVGRELCLTDDSIVSDYGEEVDEASGSARTYFVLALWGGTKSAEVLFEGIEKHAVVQKASSHDPFPSPKVSISWIVAFPDSVGSSTMAFRPRRPVATWCSMR